MGRKSQKPSSIIGRFWNSPKSKIDELLEIIVSENIEPHVFTRRAGVLKEEDEYNEWSDALGVLGDHNELVMVCSEMLEDFECILRFANETEMERIGPETSSFSMYAYYYKGVPMVIALGAIDAIFISKHNIDLFKKIDFPTISFDRKE